MEFTGQYPIPAPRDLVWQELNNPGALQACIPGCEGLDLVGDNRFEARLFAKVGPVQAKFKGTVTLQNLAPPASYDIDFEGSGGVAGFARGKATVTLAEDGGNTVLSYVAQATVGGKLAQIGQRLVDSSARKMADDFFGEFSRHCSAAAPQPAGEAAAQAGPPTPAAPVAAAAGSRSLRIAVALAIVAVAALAWWLA
ncbi:MAG: SRPBCC family protein [Gammaproteobacteria bacterium]